MYTVKKNTNLKYKDTYNKVQYVAIPCDINSIRVF